MNYIYINKKSDSGIYRVLEAADGVLLCERLNTGQKGFLFDADEAQQITFHNFLTERYKLLEDEKMKVNMTVKELCALVEEWEEFKKNG